MLLKGLIVGRRQTSCSSILNDIAKNYRGQAAAGVGWIRPHSRRMVKRVNLRASAREVPCIGLNNPFRRSYAPTELSQDSRPTRIVDSECKRPKTFKSHTTTQMTTTPFKIDLIDPAIGM